MQQHQQLQKLLALALLSDKVFETMGATGAIRRALAAVGSDAHEFSEIAARAFVTRLSRPPAPPSRPAWQVLAAECLRRAGTGLKPTERDFLVSMSRWPTRPTERQMRWLDALARSAGVAAEAAA